MFGRFNENPAMTLQDIKETKHYGRTDGRTDGQMHGRTDGQRENSKPPTNKVCGGSKMKNFPGGRVKGTKHQPSIRLPTVKDKNNTHCSINIH